MNKTLHNYLGTCRTLAANFKSDTQQLKNLVAEPIVQQPLGAGFDQQTEVQNFPFRKNLMRLMRLIMVFFSQKQALVNEALLPEIIRFNEQAFAQMDKLKRGWIMEHREYLEIHERLMDQLTTHSKQQIAVGPPAPIDRKKLLQVLAPVIKMLVSQLNTSMNTSVSSLKEPNSEAANESIKILTESQQQQETHAIPILPSAILAQINAHEEKKPVLSNAANYEQVIHETTLLQQRNAGVFKKN